jgi:hypothetical protein
MTPILIARAPSKLAALFWLTRLSWREASASRLSWILSGVSFLAILLCLSAGIEGGHPVRHPGEAEIYGGDDQPRTGPDPAPGRLTLAFGAIQIPLFRDGDGMAHFLHVSLAGWVVGAAGTLLALVGTAVWLPASLRAEGSPPLLVKPVPRWLVLLGKVAGATLFAATQAALFVGGTWLALGLRLGTWAPAYLLAAPLLVLGFCYVCGVSAALAVWTRNAAACVLGSVLFWFLCAAVNHARQSVLTFPVLAPEVTLHAVLSWMVEVGYWLMPKPLDLARFLGKALGGAGAPGGDPIGAARIGLSILSSLGFSVAAFTLAARHLDVSDY